MVPDVPPAKGGPVELDAAAVDVMAAEDTAPAVELGPMEAAAVAVARGLEATEEPED